MSARSSLPLSLLVYLSIALDGLVEDSTPGPGQEEPVNAGILTPKDYLRSGIADIKRRARCGLANAGRHLRIFARDAG
jgi:hypothetical protein